MKKTLIALAAVAVSSAAMAQVTAYGVVDTGYGWTKSESSAGVNTANTAGLVSGTMSGSRLGFRGVEDLEGGMKAGFQLEMGINATNGDLSTSQSNTSGASGFNRVAQAYVEGGFGRVSIGRHLRPSYLVSSGFDATGASSNHEVTDVTVNGARGNGIWYANTFGPVSVSALVGTGKAGKNTAAVKQKGYDASVRYAAGPLNVAFSIVSENTNNTSSGADSTVSGTAVGASYDLGVAKLMVNMVNKKTKNKVADTSTKQAETNIGATVPMGKTTLMAAYGTDKDTSATNVKSTASDWTIGASHALSKRTNVFAFMSLDEEVAASGDKNGKSNHTTVGIRHTF